MADIVAVEFLVDADDLKNADIVSNAAKEIQYYLIDKGEENPWLYAQHHCGTAANIYSAVHWPFFERSKSSTSIGSEESAKRSVMTVADLFDAGKLSPLGPVRWGTPIPVAGKGGVYVVALVGEAKLGCDELAEFLEPSEQKRWLPNQPVVYIGQTTTQTLAKRLDQFYLHKYGDTGPHRGGHALKLLLNPAPPWSPFQLWVYWSSASDPKTSERMMIDAFKKQVGRLPFANRRI